MRTASRTVVRATLKFCINAVSEGSSSSGAYSPVMMRRRSVSATNSAALGIRMWSVADISASLRDRAAVDGHRVAVDERRCVGAEPHRRGRDLLGLGEAVHRRRGMHRLLHLLVAANALDRHLRAHGTRAHRIDADPLAPVLDR